ncbi:uncharacterized protein LOC114433494 [Parambassis ranga]|uniref:Interleukin-1 n=1 Tax=Parambassis ranga TaxID=210632 RepID=A0A6P7IC16_9TELE|nr:uncharacterized protein LOC114433494 [Parambassis ranga]
MSSPLWASVFGITGSNMDLKSSVVNGGVLIFHHLHEGKHHYEVENVLKKNRQSAEKKFVRRGDKLMHVNGINLQDLTPEEVAQLLANGSPMLTVHTPGTKKEHPKQPLTSEDTIYPVSKESTILSFCWEMTREEDVEKNEEGQEEEEKETGGVKEDVCKPEYEENGESSDLLVIEMMKTSISLVRGRGCDPGSPCEGCHGTGCIFNDVVVVAESSTVKLVPRGSFKYENVSEVLVEHVGTHQYIRGICSQKTLYTSPNPERITIYYYKSNVLDKYFRGMPVVLNLTESNCFLRCCKEGDRVCLQLETCEKQRLKQIYMTDESTLSFVFYMKADRTKQRRFESALHRGWFIHVVNPDGVEVATIDGHEELSSFLFIIKK